jgi:hypothetical protein
MKLKCLHGFYLFEETQVGQLSDYSSFTGFSLVRFRDKYTFADLEDIENYSLISKPILNYLATETFSGEPWEVFEQNSVVYDFTSGLIVPISSITTKAIVQQAGNRFVSPGLILAGSYTNTAQRVKGYSAFYSRDTQRWLYSEIEYV